MDAITRVIKAGKRGKGMTLEEAIKIFLNRGWIELDGGTYFAGDKWRKAIVVISDYFRNEYKALEQEPCEYAISRQAVLDRQLTSGDCGGVAEHFSRITTCNPQPKMGHWIMSDDGLYRPICDKCGAHPWKGYIPTVEEATEVFKYCPNCGCAMFEPQESEE